MKNFSIFLAGAVTLLLASCGSGASVKGTVTDAPNAKVIVKRLNVNAYEVLDTLKTGSDGSFSFKVGVNEQDPEFVYVFYKDRKIASLLLEAGEKAVVEADTLGHYTVTGSEGSAKLQEVESRYARFVGELQKVDNPSDFVRKYLSYYRESIRYVLQNPHSLTVIPVLYETLGDNAPVFSQNTDALHFRSACDSLKTVYPESRYVKALEKETARREAELRLENELKNASSIGFPDLKLPDINGNASLLSDVTAKAVLVHFWDSSDSAQNMFAKEVLVPLYEDYHKRGLEIYSVCLDVDKVRWASVVNGQNLPWINVNDGLGTASPAVRLYNLTSVPTSVLIAEGSLVSSGIKGEAGLRKELSRLLK